MTTSQQELKLLYFQTRDRVKQDLVPVRYDVQIEDGSLGYCSNEAVFLRAIPQPDIRLHTLLHEVAHWVLHMAPNRLYDPVNDARLQEFEANQVADVLSSRLGLAPYRSSDETTWTDIEEVLQRHQAAIQRRIEQAVERIWQVIGE